MKSERIVDVVAEIRSELDALNRLRDDILRIWASLPTDAEQRRIHESAVALKLHNFYTGAEKIFELVAEELNGGAPSGRDWHKRLLHSMCLVLPGVRPPVLSEQTEAALREILAFRHIVRNIYSFDLDSERLALLVKRYPHVSAQLSTDISAFADCLASTAT